MQADKVALKRPDPLSQREHVEPTVPGCNKHGRPKGDVLAYAERHCASQDERLTPMRRDLLQVLSNVEVPLGAYEIAGRMSELRGRHITPVAAYRALDFLGRVGLVTRLESLNAFVLCAHPDHPHDCVFLLCSACGDVREVVDERLSSLLDKSTRKAGFTTERRVIEIHGICKSCQPDEVAIQEPCR